MWLTFMLCGFTGLGVVSAFGLRGSRGRYRLIAILLILLGIFSAIVLFAILTDEATTLGNRQGLNIESPYREFLLFLLMLAGMAARYFTHAIEDRRARIAELRSVGDETPVKLRFDIWEFVYPIFVSIITFGALLPQVDGEKLSFANLVVSFQTGFFWQTLLARGEKRMEIATPLTIEKGVDQ
ncbi:MAG: hypothetical protein MN733_11695 [Nitrososphaera sp.]|nr:hypothetical protein [Nitrososphaera sp.]